MKTQDAELLATCKELEDKEQESTKDGGWCYILPAVRRPTKRL
jgi:hypothetical protein